MWLRACTQERRSVSFDTFERRLCLEDGLTVWFEFARVPRLPFLTTSGSFFFVYFRRDDIDPLPKNRLLSATDDDG